jgi:sulfur-oxidizing protein SoxZ
MAKARLKVPKKAEKGEIITVKSLISHVMETGQRKDKSGKTIPRKIINKVVCTYNGKVVFECDWHPAISANPYLAFNLRANESGTVELTWFDDDGSKTTQSAKITVN